VVLDHAEPPPKAARPGRAYRPRRTTARAVRVASSRSSAARPRRARPSGPAPPPPRPGSPAGSRGGTTAPATESILSVLPAAKAGVGSAVNDATREAGGTLGVAVLGSIFTSLYADRIGSGAFALLPDPVRQAAQDSVAAAIGATEQATGSARVALIDGLQASFMSGFHVACFVAAGICWAGALGALALPGRIRAAAPSRRPVEAALS
jgi:hypothetical protein